MGSVSVEASARVRVFNLFFILMGGERKWGGNAIGIVCRRKSQYLCFTKIGCGSEKVVKQVCRFCIRLSLSLYVVSV